MEKIWSSDSSERESVPFFRYGPNRPFCAVMTSPSASAPTIRGRDISCSACSSVTVSRDMVLKREPVRGFSLAGFFLGLGLPFL